MDVREATSDDVNRIQYVHSEAIMELASAFYNQEQVKAWAEPVESANYDPESEDYYYAVAEDDEQIVGFGSLRFDSPDGYEAAVDGEITGVYVHPKVARKGVGSKILSVLEERARECGLATLGLQSSMNAVSFYDHHGYNKIREITHEFGGCIEGPAMEMKKEL